MRIGKRIGILGPLLWGYLGSRTRYEPVESGEKGPTIDVGGVTYEYVTDLNRATVYQRVSR